MSKKKFTQDIADILADDLALLESIEPGAVVRPEVENRPEPASLTPAEPEPEPEPVVAAEPTTGAEARPEPQPEPVAVAEPEPKPTPAPEPATEPEPAAAAPRAEPAAEQTVTLDAPPPGIGMAAVLHEVDALSAPSIPSGEAPDRPTRPEAPLALPPAAPPPSGQVPELDTEPASLEPPEAVAAEPMAPAHRDGTAAEVEGQPSLPVGGLEPRPHVLPEAVAARQPQAAETVSLAAPQAIEPEPDEPAEPEPAPGPEAIAPEPEAAAPEPVEEAAEPAEAEAPAVQQVAVASAPAPTSVPAGGPSGGGEMFQDAVTLLEITPPESGGAREAALPGDRSSSPPSPLPARRVGWNHPVARWTAYVLVVVALTVVFLWLMISLFRIA